MPVSSLHQRCQDLRQAAHEAALARCLPPFYRAGPTVLASGLSPEEKPLINLGSNDYLGLAQHTALSQAAHKALEQYGTGSAASRLLAGASEQTKALEIALAEWLQVPAALVYPSGYQANVGLMQALIAPEDCVFIDRLCHASQWDGLRLSGAAFRRFRHNDVVHLENALLEAQQKRQPGQAFFIVSESLFSMDGDWPDAEALLGLAEAYDATLLLDEAHALGVLGFERRAGLLDAPGFSGRSLTVANERLVRTGTFSKALGSQGGFVAGPDWAIDALVQASRGFIYTTGLAPAVTAANLEAVRLLQSPEGKALQAVLWHNARLSRQCLQESLSLEGKHSSFWQEQATPIMPLPVGDTAKALRLHKALLEAGYYVPAIRPPSVPNKKALLRLSLSALHTPSELQALAETLSAAYTSNLPPAIGQQEGQPAPLACVH